MPDGAPSLGLRRWLFCVARVPLRLGIATDDSGCAYMVAFLLGGGLVIAGILAILTVGVLIVIGVLAVGIVIGLAMALFNMLATLIEGHRRIR